MTRLVSQSMDQRLPLITSLRMKLHYIICVWCKRYAKQIAFLKRASRRFSENAANAGAEPISPDTKRRLKAEIERILR